MSTDDQKKPISAQKNASHPQQDREDDPSSAREQSLGEQRLARYASEEPWDGTDPLASLSDLGASFDLSNAHPTGVARLLASGQVTLANLFHEQADLTASERSLSKLVDEADTDRSRYGFGQIQLAVGIATWAQGRYEVPILLFPVRLGQVEGRRLVRTPIYVEQDPQINPRLVAMLRSRSILIDPQTALVDARGRDGSFDATLLLNGLEAAARRHIADFAIERRYIFGCFVNPAAELVHRAKDIASSTFSAPLIGPKKTDLAADRHTLPVLALSGDHHALAALKSQDLPKNDETDPNPHDEQEAGDVSAPVRRAAQAAADGASFLLDVPNGLESVADALAIATRAAVQGRHVLVVPDGTQQKREFLRQASLTGVSRLIMDLSDRQAGTKVDKQFVDSLSPKTGQSTAITDFDRTADELVGVRSRLSDYFDSLHKPVRPWDVSAYTAIEQLASVSALKSKPRTRVRLSSQTAKNLKGKLETTGQTLVRLGQLGEYTLKPSDTPWYGARLYTNDEAKDAQERVRRLLQTTLPAVRKQVSRTVKTCGFVVPQTIEDWGSQISVLESLRRVLDLFRPEIFDQDLHLALTATLNRKQRAAAGEKMGFWARRRVVKDVRRCLRPGQRPDDLHATLEVVARQGARWRKLVPSGGWPVLPDGLDEIISTFEKMNQDLTALDAVLIAAPGQKLLADSSFVDVDQRLRALYDDRDSLEQLPERMRLDRQMRKEGLSPLLADLINRHVKPQAAPDELKLAWWATVFESVVHSSRLIADQDASVLQEAVERFRKVDRRHVATIGPLLVKKILRRLADTLYKHRQQANQLHDLLRRETDVSATRLLTEWPTLTWAAKPIVIAGVAHLALNPLEGHLADLVILSGASHMPSAEVLVALEAADSCVAIAHRSTVTGGAMTRLANLLPSITPSVPVADMPTALAAFLARRGQRVNLLPSAGSKPWKVRLVRVQARGVPEGMSGLVESSSEEVAAVTRLVVAAALHRSQESAQDAVKAPRPLTVFTLSDYNARLLQRSLAEAARKSSDLKAFLPHVCVMPVSRAAGAQCGDVILSLGFAPTMHGVLLQQFGLLEQEGGDRLLLDALLRTSGNLAIVTAFASSDMQDERLHEPGPRMLKMLLRWAESLGVTGEKPSQHPDQEGELMSDLASRLRQRHVRASVGYGYKQGICLPLAAGTDALGYRWAVMTDNAKFMASPSLRYRFRLLPGQLHRHGWKVVGAWSVGTFINPEGVVNKIVSQISKQPGAFASPDSLSHVKADHAASSLFGDDSSRSAHLPEGAISDLLASHHVPVSQDRKAGTDSSSSNVNAGKQASVKQPRQANEHNASGEQQ